MGLIRRAAAAYRDAGQRRPDQAATAELDVATLAPRVQAPTLVIHFRNDRRAPLGEGRRLATLIPDSRLVVLDSTKHIPLRDEPAWARFVDELNGFLGD